MIFCGKTKIWFKIELKIVEQSKSLYFSSQKLYKFGWFEMYYLFFIIIIIYGSEPHSV